MDWKACWQRRVLRRRRAKNRDFYRHTKKTKKLLKRQKPSFTTQRTLTAKNCVDFPEFWPHARNVLKNKKNWGPKLSRILLTQCGQLILGKISKFDATRRQVLGLKCTKFDFRCGSAPCRPRGGAYSAPQIP